MKRIQLYYLLEYSVRLLWEKMRQELKNKKNCWSVMCNTSAVTLFNKLTNKSLSYKSPDYSYNGSIDIAVDAVST